MCAWIYVGVHAKHPPVHVQPQDLPQGQQQVLEQASHGPQHSSQPRAAAGCAVTFKPDAATIVTSPNLPSNASAPRREYCRIARRTAAPSIPPGPGALGGQTPYERLRQKIGTANVTDLRQSHS